MFLSNSMVWVFLLVLNLLVAKTTSQNYNDSSIAQNEASSPLLLGASGKKYFVQFFFRANWFRASQFCRYNGMQLAAINSHDDWAILERQIIDLGRENERFWLSGNDLLDEDNFSWMSNGRPIVFQRWGPGQPDNLNGVEDCVELLRFQWNDNVCSNQFYFICEH